MKTAVGLYSYVVRWDHGFAPNPFYGWCTVATCKPKIRKKAKVGDWLLGTGSKKVGYDRRVICLMRVTGDSAFDDYWRDPRFQVKKPVLNGSFKQMFGDNIYHREQPDGEWIQSDSRHSQPEGLANLATLKPDTATTDRVLLSDDFIYWGQEAPTLPPGLAGFQLGRQGAKHRFADADVERLLDWALASNRRGRVGDPVEWRDDLVAKWRNTGPRAKA